MRAHISGGLPGPTLIPVRVSIIPGFRRGCNDTLLNGVLSPQLGDKNHGLASCNTQTSHRTRWRYLGFKIISKGEPPSADGFEAQPAATSGDSTSPRHRGLERHSDDALGMYSHMPRTDSIFMMSIARAYRAFNERLTCGSIGRRKSSTAIKSMSTFRRTVWVAVARALVYQNRSLWDGMLHCRFLTKHHCFHMSFRAMAAQFACG